MTDILWVIVSAGLVFLMQPGFMCLESGLTRSKNNINVAVKNLADFGISVTIFWLFGYALMFGLSQWGVIGQTGFLLDFTGSPQIATFFLFQMMFCSTATTIVSGAVAERLKFNAYLVISAIASGFIYPIYGHWVWNGVDQNTSAGWLGQLGFVDFAGSTVVHSVGGWIGLATLMVIGPRLGRFPQDQSPQTIHGSNLPLSVLGAMLLWFGWLGFNGGSTLALTPQVPVIIVNTVIAGAGGMITAAIIGWKRRKLPKVESLVNGSIAGLVAITASCHAVSTPLAFLIGSGGAAAMIIVIYLLNQWRIDDAVDAVAVHGGAGAWGTLSVGFFGQLDLLGTGLGRWQQIGVQGLGIAVGFLWAFGLTWIILNITNRIFPLRVSADDETKGLNVSEHDAKTEVYDLLEVMDYQARTQDLSARVPVTPFTEVGHIASRYNQVMTAMEEAITQTHAIVSTATDAIITFNTSTLQVLTANPSAEKVFRYSAEELLRLSIADLIGWSAETISDRATLLKRLLNNGQQEMIGHRAGGVVFPLEVTLTKANLGARSFFTGTFRDITERKQAEEAIRHKQHSVKLQRTLEELQRAQTQLIQSEKMSSVGQMVAGVAHEINNPVNFISGNLVYAKKYTEDLIQLIDRYQELFPEIPDDLQELIEDIELDFLKEDLPNLQDSLLMGTERIQEIVQSLRTFSRLDEAEVKQVDIHEGIESTLMILKNRLKAAIPRLEYPIAVVKDYANLPRVECYAGQLNQVFMNLLANAIDALAESWERGKFVDGEHPTIWIYTQIIDADWLRIRILDNGMGIKPETQSKLFDPFFTTKEVGKGTGLGLSISYQVVVERHHGRMICQSETGQGAEFIVEIPMVQTPEGAIASSDP
ncbi:ammonium transporter [Spirulina major CS-329]|uniref:ammonium transporter n=1 Tax=Spirulina TaxID=1154 RepID=UPI002330FDDA|nr:MULTISPECIES: ammonium transporter [Spirulina]MDB9496558.1 ammonium transporter [Spirulina subsalsa CS-330]MDB9504181.1 ammonium transporter [Spirulina major CS-329]